MRDESSVDATMSVEAGVSARSTGSSHDLSGVRMASPVLPTASQLKDWRGMHVTEARDSAMSEKVELLRLRASSRPLNMLAPSVSQDNPTAAVGRGVPGAGTAAFSCGSGEC